MIITWDEIAQGFEYQLTFTEGYSPLYHAIYGYCHEQAINHTNSSFRHILESSWANRPFSGWLEPSLLVPAAIHAAVLDGDPAADKIRAFFATVDGHFTEADTTALHTGLDYLFTEQGEILPWFLTERKVQTNEIGRSAAWLMAAYIFKAWIPELTFTVIDFGTSAGLNLSADYQGWQWDINGASYTVPNPNPISQHIELSDDIDIAWPDYYSDSQLPTPLPIEKRIGIDQNPLDLHDPADQLALRACVWGDQPERLTRFDHATENFLRMPTPQFFQGDIIEAAQLLPKLVENPASSPHLLLVFNSAVTAYFDDTAYQTLRNNLMHAFQTLPAGTAGLWLENETPRYNETVTRAKHFLIRARMTYFGGISSFYLGEIEAHPKRVYLHAGWQGLQDMLKASFEI